MFVTPFSFWIAAGASIGLLRIRMISPANQAEKWVDAGLFALAGALVGARLAFVIVRLAYYRANPIEVLEIWKGGLSWPGALMGGWLVVFLLACFWRMPWLTIGDRLAALILPLGICAWLGAFQAGSAYGQIVPAGAWWGLPTLDESGLWLSRFPLQIAAAVVLLLFLVWFEIKQPEPAFQGYTFAITGLALSAVMFAASFLRGDSAPVWLSIRVETWVAFVFCLFFGMMSLIKHFRRHSKPDDRINIL
jgi:phosphatidylglycerol---prolipoprotein diacylglyceryl transferase